MQNQNEQQNNQNQQTTRQQLQPAQNKNLWKINKHNIGWFILSFCIPIVGYILAIVWWKSQPNNARVSLSAAIASSILGLLMSL